MDHQYRETIAGPAPLGGYTSLTTPGRQSAGAAAHTLLEQLQKTAALIGDIETRVLGPHPVPGMGPAKDRTSSALLDVLSELRDISDSNQGRLMNILEAL